MRNAIPALKSIFVSAALLIALAACLPTSENPIVKRGQPVIDNRLIGSWYGSMEEGDDPLFMHIFEADIDEDKPAPHPQGIRIVMASHPYGTNIDGGWAIMFAVSATNQSYGVLSLYFEDDSGEEVSPELVGWHLYGYSFDTLGQLMIQPLDEDAVLEAIETGRIAGTAKETKFFSEIRITASSSELVKLFDSADWPQLLSEDVGLFVKQNPAEPVFP